MRYFIQLARIAYWIMVVLTKLGIPENRLRSWIERLMRFLMRRGLIQQRVLKPISIDGYTVYWQPCWLILDWIVGRYEPNTTRIIRSLLQPSMRAIDIGAHIGYYTLLMAQAVGPKGHVYAFEPDQSVLRLLRKNVEVNEYETIVTIMPKAVSSHSGKAKFHKSSLYAEVFNSTKAVSVDTISLDGFFSAEGYPRIDIIKMDIEGAEEAALEGMNGLSKRNPQLKLIVEFNPSRMRRTGAKRKEFFDKLQKLGFNRFYMIDDLQRDKGLVELSIPNDIEHLVQELREVHVNLLCKKSARGQCHWCVA